MTQFELRVSAGIQIIDFISSTSPDLSSASLNYFVSLSAKSFPVVSAPVKGLAGKKSCLNHDFLIVENKNQKFFSKISTTCWISTL